MLGGQIFCRTGNFSKKYVKPKILENLIIFVSNCLGMRFYAMKCYLPRKRSVNIRLVELSSITLKTMIILISD